MHIAYTPEQQALQDEVRAMLAELLTDDVRAELAVMEGGGPLYHGVMEELAAGGWLGVGWPEEYGGQARTPIEEFIFFDEVHRSGFPIPLLTLNTVGPTLIAYGSDAQKADLLPKILQGKMHFSIGYSEPSAGTDLASLKTTAVLDGDEYVINGQKIWISLADFADVLWCACKTDPDARHKGISVIMVPMDAEGVSHTPIQNLGDSNIHAVYLDNVRVPATNRVGPENGGWRMITSQLNHERVALMMVGPLARLIADVRDWAKQQPDGDGVLLADVAPVGAELPRAEADHRDAAPRPSERPLLHRIPIPSSPCGRSQYGRRVLRDGSTRIRRDLSIGRTLDRHPLDGRTGRHDEGTSHDHHPHHHDPGLYAVA